MARIEPLARHAMPELDDDFAFFEIGRAHV